MRTPEQIFDEAIQAKGLDIVSVKDADLYEAGLDAIRQALNIANVVGRSEQLLAFAKWMEEQPILPDRAEQVVKYYLESE